MWFHFFKLHYKSQKLTGLGSNYCIFCYANQIFKPGLQLHAQSKRRLRGWSLSAYICAIWQYYL